MTARIKTPIVPSARHAAAGSFAASTPDNVDDAGGDLSALNLPSHAVVPYIVLHPHNTPISTEGSSVQTQKIAAVTVTYNRLDKLRIALGRTLAEDLDYIVIVNNNSTDATAVWLNSLTDSRIRVLHLPENLGGAGGFHEGLKYTNENLHVDWLVCFDDDAWPDTGAISKFRQLQLNTNVGAITACVKLPSGKLSEMNRPGYSPFRSFSSFLRTALHGSKGFHIIDDVYKPGFMIPVDWCSFVGFFIKCSIISEKVGYPQKELFLYGDDVMYTLSMTEKEYILLFVSDIVFITIAKRLGKGKRYINPCGKPITRTVMGF